MPSCTLPFISPTPSSRQATTYPLVTTYRVQSYDAQRGTLTLRDGTTSDTLRVDVSLCLSPFGTYPWLQERNTVVVVVGYLEPCEDTHDGHSNDDEYGEDYGGSDAVCGSLSVV